MSIEVIVQNGAEAIEAEKLGADRLELVSAMREGGLTPSYGTIKQVLKSVSIPVYIMVRPHSYHYFYNDRDLEIIHNDINQILELGGHRIVFGALNEDYTVNEKVLQRILDISGDLEVTFHRAFDETRSLTDAYQTLEKYNKQVKTILTSGGAADCIEGQASLQNLLTSARSGNGPEIMPGSGLGVDNIAHVHHMLQAESYHFGKAVRIEQSFANGYDAQAMQTIKQKMND